MYSFPNVEPIHFSMSASNCCFLTCIQISQEAGQVVWYSHLLEFSTVLRRIFHSSQIKSWDSRRGMHLFNKTTLMNSLGCGKMVLWLLIREGLGCSNWISLYNNEGGIWKLLGKMNSEEVGKFLEVKDHIMTTGQETWRMMLAHENSPHTLLGLAEGVLQ